MSVGGRGGGEGGEITNFSRSVSELKGVPDLSQICIDPYQNHFFRRVCFNAMVRLESLLWSVQC